MGDSWSPGCAYTGSPNHDLGARDPRSPVSVDPWGILLHMILTKIETKNTKQFHQNNP